MMRIQKKIFISYDKTRPYPQAAKFGLGVNDEKGKHTPPQGLSSFGIDESAFINGFDERLYDVTAVDTLTAKKQSEVDVIAEQDSLPGVKRAKQVVIDAGYAVAEDVTVSLGGFTFDAGTKALTEAMSVVVAMQEGYTLPTGFTWIDAGGTAQPTNAAGMKALFKKISVKHYRDAHKYSKLTKQVNSATSLVEVNSVADW